MNFSLFDQLILRYDDLMVAFVQHIELVFWSMLIAIMIGIPLGIFVTRFTRTKKIILGGAGILQTIPSLAILGFMIPIFGIGTKTAIAALFLYSLMPIIRNTCTGLTDVDKQIIEAAKGMGMTRAQILFKIKLPLSLSIILAGIRTATMINVGTATLAAFIGAGGLGEFIFIGISRNIDALVLLGAIPTALLAVLLDFMLGYSEKLATPKGLKI